MNRFSNTAIGYLNLLTLLASIPIIGGGLWLARSSATCESSLQTPILVLGFVVLLVSLAGFVGACFNVAWALWLYLFVMLLLIAALLGLTAFGFAVTGGGGGEVVPGRVYREFRLEDYNGWLRRRITDVTYWRAARACVVGSRACAQLQTWTPLDYLQRDLTPIQLTGRAVACCGRRVAHAPRVQGEGWAGHYSVQRDHGPDSIRNARTAEILRFLPPDGEIYPL